MVGDRERALVARGIINVRAARKAVFPPELFDEQAWDMLLHLFVGLVENGTISEAGLLARSGTTESVGQRWLRYLVEEGHVASRRDGDDVALTAAAIASMRAFLDQVGEMDRANGGDESAAREGD